MPRASSLTLLRHKQGQATGGELAGEPTTVDLYQRSITNTFILVLRTKKRAYIQQFNPVAATAAYQTFQRFADQIEEVGQHAPINWIAD